MSGSAQVIRGNALALPIPDDTVDLICTSPPYFALRSYTDGGQHYAGQVGSEATPAEFVDTLIAATAEMVRVLKPSGSIWVNLGDKYSSTSAGSNWSSAPLAGGRGRLPELHDNQLAAPRLTPGAPPKSLIGIPWRYALRCIDDLGLILRAEVVWSKPNGLPESVTDRVRRSHEQWFHLTVQPRYYSAVDEVREGYAPATAARYALGYKANGRVSAGQMSTPSLPIGEDAIDTNPLGKLPGSVWTIPTQPLTVPAHLGVDHFAAFPTEWPRRIITGWSPREVCTACGEGRRPVSVHLGYTIEGGVNNGTDPTTTTHGVGAATLGMVGTRTITGYTCACDPSACRVCGVRPTRCYEGNCCGSCTHDTTAPTTPGIVLDPFGGTGTTAMVAKALGRHGITVDLSADYCRLAQWRTCDPDQLAKAQGIRRSDAARAADGLDMDYLFDMDEPVRTARPSGGIAYANAAGRNCTSCGYRTQRPSGCERCSSTALDGGAA